MFVGEAEGVAAWLWAWDTLPGPRLTQSPCPLRGRVPALHLLRGTPSPLPTGGAQVGSAEPLDLAPVPRGPAVSPHLSEAPQWPQMADL